MTIVINLAKSTVNFIVLNAIMIAANPQDVTFYIGSLLAILMGFLLRIVMEWKKNTITWKSSFIQAVMSLSLCYLSVLIWKDYSLRIRLEYYLFFCSLFSVFIVDVLEKTFKMVLPNAVRLLLTNFLAPKEAKPKDGEDQL